MVLEPLKIRPPDTFCLIILQTDRTMLKIGNRQLPPYRYFYMLQIIGYCTEISIWSLAYVLLVSLSLAIPQVLSPPHPTLIPLSRAPQCSQVDSHKELLYISLYVKDTSK